MKDIFDVELYDHIAGAISRDLGLSEDDTRHIIEQLFGEESKRHAIRSFMYQLRYNEINMSEVIRWTKDDWHELQDKSEEELRDCGLRIWDRFDSGMTLWLYPAEWYEHIPEGFPIYTIDNKKENFALGVTDEGSRFGCLSYGFLKQTDKTALEGQTSVFDEEED